MFQPPSTASVMTVPATMGYEYYAIDVSTSTYLDPSAEVEWLTLYVTVPIVVIDRVGRICLFTTRRSRCSLLWPTGDEALL